jgi:cardiolipin synthase
MEQYIFCADGIGTQFLEVFKQKAQAGIRVRLLLDAVGSWSVYRNVRIQTELAEAGVELRWYNRFVPLLLHRLGAVYFRNHRKLLVVDKTVGHIGGLNIRDDMATWRETHARVKGEAVWAMSRSFAVLWRKCKLSIPHLVKRTRQPGGGGYEFVPNSPGRRRAYAYKAIRRAIQTAKQRVWITVPYFIPTVQMLYALAKARARGVDVRILLPEKNDLPLLGVGMHSYFGTLLRAGVGLYLYQPHVLHAKVVVVDDAWATVGSLNFDNVSLRCNLEANLVTTDTKTVGELAEHFETDLTQSKALTYEFWQERPLKQKVLEKLLWPFHAFL